MTAATVPPDVAAYLAAVRDALDDLPSAERDDLVAEVEASLVESAGEGGAIGARLGPPEEFAAELRAAAGLHEPISNEPKERRLVKLAERISDWRARDPRAESLHRAARELAPIWWVARGYLAVALLGMAVDASWSTAYPAVPQFGGGETGMLVIVAAVALSCWIGLRTRRDGTTHPRAHRAANVLLVLAVVPVAIQLANVPPRIEFVYEPTEAQVTDGLAWYGVQIQNIYPYSRDGRLLHDVLLYDANGNPLEIAGVEDPNRRYVETSNGRVFNSFPIRYYEPGTTEVAEPDAGPEVAVPRIFTPPLDVER